MKWPLLPSRSQSLITISATVVVAAGVLLFWPVRYSYETDWFCTISGPTIGPNSRDCPEELPNGKAIVYKHSAMLTAFRKPQFHLFDAGMVFGRSALLGIVGGLITYEALDLSRKHK